MLGIKELDKSCKLLVVAATALLLADKLFFAPSVNAHHLSHMLARPYAWDCTAFTPI